MLRGSNSVCLNGQPIRADLEALLGRELCASPTTPTASRCRRRPTARGAGAEVVFGVILGTGVGAGIVVRGRVLTGPNAIAGEWGHNPLPWPRDDERPGPACFCGQRGCIETFLSGPGIARDHLRDHRRARWTRSGDRGARGRRRRRLRRDAVQRYEERLARALAHVINLLDPDVIVLGGGMSNVDRLYAERAALWGPWVFSDRVDTRLVRHLHGDSSGVRGAAWLWPLTP